MVDREGNLLTNPNDPRLGEVVKEQGIFGAPGECIEAIKTLQQALPSLNHLVCRFEFPGLNYKRSMESMKPFAGKVMPHIK